MLSSGIPYYMVWWLNQTWIFVLNRKFINATFNANFGIVLRIQGKNTQICKEQQAKESFNIFLKSCKAERAWA